MLGRCAIVSGGRSAKAAVDALASLAEELARSTPSARSSWAPSC